MRSRVSGVKQAKQASANVKQLDQQQKMEPARAAAPAAATPAAAKMMTKTSSRTWIAFVVHLRSLSVSC